MWRRRCLEAVALLLGSTLGSCSPLRAWEDAEAMAWRALANLTLQERAQLVKGEGWHAAWQLENGFYMGNIRGIPEKGIPWLKMQDSGSGFRCFRSEAVHTSVMWPSPLAAASSWDDKMVELLAAFIGLEFRSKGSNAILGPAVNVHRIAQGGRNFEYMSGEDPYLGARLARAYVKGAHSQGVMTVIKHFAFNEQETNRHQENSVVDDRTAWELYYPPFEAAVHEGAASFMCSYNIVNGTQSCANAELLKRDLKGKMGFRGFVMSDWGASASTGLAEGGDMDMPGFEYSWYAFDKVAESQALHESARRILTAMYRHKLDESMGCVPPDCLDSIATDTVTHEGVALAKELATSAVVLLKNHDQTLPIDTTRIKKIGVLGKAAHAKPAGFNPSDPTTGDEYSGGGSGHVYGTSGIKTPFEAIQERAAASGVHATADENAADVDILVVVAAAVGGHEKWDRKDLSLIDDADRVIGEAVGKLKPVVVLLMLPGATLMPWREDVSAIASVFYGGQETGHAFASILFGDKSPSGKLPIMIPDSSNDVISPTLDLFVPYREGMATSYRNPGFKAAFPFGHGLSYTTFGFEAIVVEPHSPQWLGQLLLSPSAVPLLPPGLQVPASEAMAQVSLKVVNTGSRAGAEVVQAYVNFPDAPPGTPELQLRGYRKTRQLQPGEEETVVFAFNARDFSTYTPQGGWRLHKKVILHLGTSSRDLRKEFLLEPVAAFLAKFSTGLSASLLLEASPQKIATVVATFSGVLIAITLVCSLRRRSSAHRGVASAGLLELAQEDTSCDE